MDRDTKGKFVKGHSVKQEWVEKSRLINTGHVPWNKGKKTGIKPVGGFKKGQEAWNKGKLKESPGYSALHKWVVKERGRASRCEWCGTKTAKKYEWASKSREYKRELDDWLELCTKCHRTHDR